MRDSIRAPGERQLFQHTCIAGCLNIRLAPDAGHAEGKGGSLYSGNVSNLKQQQQQQGEGGGFINDVLAASCSVQLLTSSSFVRLFRLEEEYRSL